MPPDQADWFLTEIVLPTARDFLNKPADIRLGMLAAVVVSSLADYIYEERPAARGSASTVGKFREKLARESKAFALTRDAGDATKHVRLTRGSADFKCVRDMERKS